MLFFLILITFCASNTFDKQVNLIKQYFTPFIGKEDTANYTDPFMLLGFTFDCVTRELRLPIMDMTQSPIVNQSVSKTQDYSYHFDSVTNYLDTMNSITSDEYPFVNGMFSHNEDIVQMYKKYFSGNCQLVVAQREFTYWVKSVNPGAIVFNQEFQTIVNSILPKEYDPTMYNRFIQEFGTHLSFSANFGGLVEVQVFLETCAFGKIDEKIINSESVQDLLWWIGHSKSNRTQGNQQYIERRYVHTEDISGGNPLIECTTNCNDRIASFKQNPVVTSFNYVSIPYLIDDPTIQSNLMKAIGDYVEGDKTTRDKNLAEVGSEKQKKLLAPKTCTVTLSEDTKDQIRYSIKANSDFSFKIQRGNVNVQFWIERKNYQIRLSAQVDGKRTYGSWGDQYSMLPGVVWRSGHFIYDSDVYAFYNCEQIESGDKGALKCACPIFS